MDPKDKKEIAQLVGEVIDKKVTPRLEKLESGQAKLDAGQQRHTELSQAIMEQEVKNSEEITVLQEDVSDMGYTLERIETAMETVTRRQDNLSIKTSQLNRRVLHLESKKSSNKL